MFDILQFDIMSLLSRLCLDGEIKQGTVIYNNPESKMFLFDYLS